MLYNNLINKIIYKQHSVSVRLWILIPVTIILIISFLTLNYTALEDSFFSSTFIKQMIWFGIGVLIVALIQSFRIQFFQEYAYHFYIILLILISLTYFMPVIGGSRRWISFGEILFQPSEFGKLILVFVLARLLSGQQGKMYEVKLLILTIMVVLLPCFLIFQQPDFGTSIVYGFIVIPMLYWSGIRSVYLFVIMTPLVSIVSAFNIIFFSIWMSCLIIALYLSQPKVFHGVLIFIINVIFGILSPYIWNNILYPHQQERILTLINPMHDPHGSGYQVIQSVIAIGSGGFWGKGLGQGTQTQLRYLPVRDTDFIISVVAEEWGLFGIIIIMISFYVMIYWIIIFASSISNRFSSLCLVGFASIIFIHLSVNMGMAVGLLPVTGLPAPFMSYGGSFLLTCMIALGFVNNIVNYHTK